MHRVHGKFHLIILQCGFSEIQHKDTYSLISGFSVELCCFLDGYYEEQNIYLACHERSVKKPHTMLKAQTRTSLCLCVYVLKGLVYMSSPQLNCYCKMSF